METDEGTGTTGGQEGGNTEGGEGDTGKTVPLSRLSEVIGQRDTARSRLAELEKQLAEQSPKLEQLTTLQTTLETERTEYARNQSAWEQTKALMRGGLVDDDGLVGLILGEHLALFSLELVERLCDFLRAVGSVGGFVRSVRILAAEFVVLFGL